MFSKIIYFSIKNKRVVFGVTLFVFITGLVNLFNISLTAVPDVTNNQVQVITTSSSLSTVDVEQFITTPLELEMSNLQGVKEIRSISKYGISLITIVFKDDMGVYLPRQIIAEKIRTISEVIPIEFGVPEIGPTTTGLGEIYQYVLDVSPNYKKRYTIMELRTIQDWIVKRQLSGIQGVIEINTWGGYLKQYEVSLSTDKLEAMNINISDVFLALEENNSIAGGSYIEKANQAYYIRGEGLMKTPKEIENTLVKLVNNVPIYIKDIAIVGLGFANRLGAITANGEGEKVLGQVMMFKGEDSNQVIKRVKQRVKEISKTLPIGIKINPFLERSKLIKETSSTILENVVFACLIVIFIVVLLLGNLRSGILVAAVIPLSMLIALQLMYIFDLEVNLMSMGAIDFGIIIDGAVIIVEYILFQFVTKSDKILKATDPRLLKDDIVNKSATKMMKSAFFGQLIILIAFIPIFTLEDIEGKMFKPMIVMFCFALMASVLLSLTFVPAMASLLLKPVKNQKEKTTTKIFTRVQETYLKVIKRVFRVKRIILSFSIVFFVISLILYNKLGSEFVPTLDEGDIVIQPVLKTGTSLSKTIEKTTEIETLLMRSFPEINQIVSRIGAAEIPTDPMSMEDSDIMIILKSKKEWVSAKTKTELIEKFKKTLSVIPNLGLEFTQPMEMRFNELITGTKSHIAIKVYGENLNTLLEIGKKIENSIKSVKGADDIVLEKTEGLPQIFVKYNREKLANYGIHIKEVNKILMMGFAGHKVGQIYENERRFDLVLRLSKNRRRDLLDVKNLYIDIPNTTTKVPLSQLATISYKNGPAKISRDNTRRRIVVGVNCRTRDIQSVVDDIKKKVSKEVIIPVGYEVSYGGQFENLQKGKKRLMLIVPFSMCLMIIVLFFAFKSIKDVCLIFSAVPFSIIGGICLLWVREMPFSISAGIGFIALFGISVLNGIVLINHFRELKTRKKINTAEELVILGVKNRLRAVLLTALAAIAGFLPMAFSEGTGAEVQRPLSTVVIGGLVTSTISTLIVLPILYTMFNKSSD